MSSRILRQVEEANKELWLFLMMFSILAALNYRTRTGRGQHVEASLMASALSGMVNQASAYVAGGIVPNRMGNAHPSLFPYDPFPTADQDLIVIAGNNGQFRRLCEVLGLPDLPSNASRRARSSSRRCGSVPYHPTHLGCRNAMHGV